MHAPGTRDLVELTFGLLLPAGDGTDVEMQRIPLPPGVSAFAAGEASYILPDDGALVALVFEITDSARTLTSATATARVRGAVLGSVTVNAAPYRAVMLGRKDRVRLKADDRLRATITYAGAGASVAFVLRVLVEYDPVAVK